MKTERYIIPSIFGHDIGIITEDTRGVFFQYHDGFDTRRYPISPYRLPQEPGRVFGRYDNMSANGLPGIFADSLPDRFGSVLMEAYFARTSGALSRLSTLEKLAYIGQDGIGAIEYRPGCDDDTLPPLGSGLRELSRSIRRIIEGSTQSAFEELTAHPIPSPAGGARPKLSVLWDRRGDHLTIGRTDRATPSQEPWIVKFDEPGASLTRIEAAYMQIARELQIETATTELVEVGDQAHLLSKRFDRDGTARLHQATLAGLIHGDMSILGYYSYDTYFQIALLLMDNAPHAAKEVFRRMVFNVVGRNCDDHIKNVSFLMDADGIWRHAPAYDLIHSDGEATFGEHRMLINAKANHITTADLAAVGYRFGLEKRFMQSVIEATSERFARADATLRDYGVPEATITTIRSRLHLLSAHPFPDRKKHTKRRPK
jgi:serine/threonine-protein kinase HipA